MFTQPGGQFALVFKDGHPYKLGMGSPAEVTLAQRTGLIAPQKPENPPAASPAAVEVADLSPEERDVLYSYPAIN